MKIIYLGGTEIKIPDMENNDIIQGGMFIHEVETSTIETKKIEKIKEYIFGKNRLLCDTEYCGRTYGYCPRYNCACLDKLKSYSDRQWQNAITCVDINYKSYLFGMHEYAYKVVDYLWRHKGENDE